MNSADKTKPTALIVDDESPIVEFIAYSMTQAGYNTVTATSNKEALTAIGTLGKVAPQLAIIDIAIGAESGIDLAHTLLARYKKLRVLFISGFVNDMVMVDSFPNGIRTGFLQKVFSVDQLNKAIADLLKD
jgi:ActR/RegA family two-component response regulator